MGNSPPSPLNGPFTPHSLRLQLHMLVLLTPLCICCEREQSCQVWELPPASLSLMTLNWFQFSFGHCRVRNWKSANQFSAAAPVDEPVRSHPELRGLGRITGFSLCLCPTTRSDPSLKPLASSVQWATVWRCWKGGEGGNAGGGVPTFIKSMELIGKLVYLQDSTEGAVSDCCFKNRM